MDKWAVKLLVVGYASGASVDQLIKDLEGQGYKAPSSTEIVFRLIAHRLVPLADRATSEDTKTKFQEAIDFACEYMHTDPALYYHYQGFARKLNPDPAREQEFERFVERTGLRIPPFRPDLVLKLFDRHAAILFVTKFREGLSLGEIFDVLRELKWDTPSLGQIDRLLGANGLCNEYQRSFDERRELYRGRVWGEILVPDNVFEGY